MNYVGIDIHKRYSVLCAQDEKGAKLKEARIEGHEIQDYARFFQQLEGPSQAVLEACWNWGAKCQHIGVTSNCCKSFDLSMKSKHQISSQRPINKLFTAFVAKSDATRRIRFYAT